MVRYRTRIALSDVVSYYRSEMARRGWRELRAHSAALSAAYPGEILAFGRPGGRCTVAVSRSEAERAVMVTLLVESHSGEGRP